MKFKDKKSNEIQNEHGILVYTSLKKSLEARGIDGATAGQTSWLFVSFIFAIIFGVILTGITFIFDIKIIKITRDNDIFIDRFLLFLIIIHFFVVIIRLKYFIVNGIFFCIAYIGFVIFEIKNIYIIVSSGFILFIIYLLIPIYSWRIKILDGVLYFFYAIAMWFIVYY